MGVYGSVGTERDYSRVLDHQNNTGSAIFVSECIHTGRLPMTTHPDPSEATSCDETGNIGTFDEKGWRVCPATEFSWTYGSASPNWRDHLGVKLYFSSDSFYAEITPSEVSDAVHFDDFLGIGLAGSIKSGGDSALASMFDSGDLATVEVGDYIFLPLQGVTSHGFLIVGWGPLRDVQDGIQYAIDYPLSVRRNPNLGHLIPYIADFCYGSDGSDDGTGWLQDPRPRPFYSSAVLISNANLRTDQEGLLQIPDGFSTEIFNYFSSELWQFHKLPDYVTVPLNRMECV